MNAAFAKKRWPEKNGVFIQVQEMQWVGAIWQKTCQKMEFNNSNECDALLAPYLLRGRP